MQSTKPLQEYLEMPFDEERDQLEMSKFLPHALFVVFNETRAYAKVFGKWGVCIAQWIAQPLYTQPAWV